MMDATDSELSFSAAGGVRLGTAGGGLEILGDGWSVPSDAEGQGNPESPESPESSESSESPESWALPEPDPAVADPSRTPEVFRVRLARPRALAEAAGGLVERRYQARGYEVRRNLVDPCLYTFAAYERGQLVGTLGVRLDSKTNGLKIDEEYQTEVDELRADGMQLMELTRLAVAEPAASKEVLSALFHTALLFGHVVRGCTHAVIEVNPRHVAFYRRVLSFKPLGPQRHLDRVGAPAVALKLELSRLNEMVEEFFAKPDWSEQTNSFFVHWFNPKDAEGILGRLRRLEEGQQMVDLRSAAQLHTYGRTSSQASAA